MHAAITEPPFHITVALAHDVTTGQEERAAAKARNIEAELHHLEV